MKVIFDDSFLKKLQVIDNTLEITNYIIGSYYKKINSVSELFQESYLSRDIRKTSKFIINAIWEEKEKLLKINLEIDKSIQENLTENEYNFIYCYYLEPDEESEKIAFILSGDLKKEETTYNIDPIDFSISKNIISVVFPQTTLANIKVSQEEDTNFLEGYGIQLGTNLFSVTGDGLENELVSRDSYLTYIRNIKTSDSSKIIPYLNTEGEEVNNIYTYTTYSNLNIYTVNTNYNEQIPTDSSLYKEGGSIQLLGTFNYTKYTVKNNVVVDVETGVDDISELIDIKLTCIDNNEFTYSYDNITKIIKYDKVIDTDKISSGTFIMSIHFLDPLSSTIYSIDSNKLKLSQEENTEWEVSTKDEYFIENGRRLYLFDYVKNDTKSFLIKLNGQLTDVVSVINTLLDENNEPTVISNEFFSVSSNSEFIEDGNYTNITITLKTKKENTSTEYWNPSFKSEDEEITSKLILTTVSIGDNSENFYMVQCPKLGGMDLYIKKDNSFKKISEILIPNLDKDKQITLYLSNNDNIEEPKYWKILDRSNKLIINPTNGLLNLGNPDTWEETPSSLQLIADIEDNNSVYTTDLGNLLFGRTSNMDDTTIIDPSNWKDLVNIGRLKIPVKLEGADAEINTPDVITVSEIGVYEFKVKSNCPTKLIIYGDGTNNKNNNIVFYDNNSTTLELNEYNNVDGVSVFIKHQFTNFSKNSGELLDYGTISITPLQETEKGESILVKQSKLELLTYNPIIKYVDSSSNIIYINSNPNKTKLTGIIKYFCNKTASLSLSSNRSVEILKNDIVFSKTTSLPDRGYNWNEVEWGLSLSNDSWPSKYSGNLNIRPYGESNSIDYLFYQLGPSPEISLIDANNFIYIGPNAGDYVDVRFNSSLTTLTVSHKDEPGYSDSMNRTLSRTTTPGIYNLRIQRTEANLTNKAIYLGTVTISSYVDVNNFTDPLNPIEITQEEIDEMLKPASFTLTLYQNSLISGNVEITGSVDNVAPEGEVREYGISAPLGYECKVNSFNEYASVILGSQNNIIFNINNIIDSNKEIMLSETDPEVYINYSKSRTVGFEANIRTGSVNVTRNISMLQLGYQSGLIYKSSLKNKNILYIDSNNNLEPLIIQEYVSNNTTSFTFFLGQFNINKEILDGTEGSSVTLEEIKEDNNNILKFTNNKPIYYKDESSKNYNITVEFPSNPNTEEITRSFLAKSVDSTTGTVSTIRFEIIQGSKEYTVIPSDNSNYLYFHSTGYCIQNGYENLNIIDPKLETDIPSSKNIEITVADITTGEEHKYGESQLLGFEYTVDYVSIGTNLPSSRILRINGKINPNNASSELAKNYQLRLRAEGDNRILWSKLIRQGFSDIYLELPNSDDTLSNGEEAGSTTPYYISGDNSESNRLIFPVRYLQKEYTRAGGALNSITNEINLDQLSIDTTEEYKQSWINKEDPSMILGGNVFYMDSDHQFGTYYVKTDSSLQEKVPFIENRYTTKENYYTTEIPIKIEFNILCPFPSLGSDVNLRYNYKLNVVKSIYNSPYLNILDNNIPTIQQEGRTISVKFETNVISNVLIYNSDKTGSSSWLHIGNYTPVSGTENQYSVQIVIDPNLSPEKRTGEITFSLSNESIKKTLTIEQLSSSPYITCDDSIKEVNSTPEGYFIEFTVKHNIDYTISINYEGTDKNWIQQIESGPTSTDFVEYLRFTVNKNNTVSNRTCKILLSGESEYSNISTELSIIQYKGEEYINITPSTTDYSIFDTGGAIEFTIDSNSLTKCNVEVIYLSGGNNWIVLDKELSDIELDHYLYNVTSNITELDRGANIKITSQSKEKIISVSQSGKNKPEIVISKGTYFETSFNESKNVVENLTFETNMNYDDVVISVDKEYSSWLNAKITNKNTIIIEVTTNTSTDERTGIINLSVGYPDAPELMDSKEITVVQKGRPYINVDNIINLENDKEIEKQIIIKSNISFIYEIKDSWIKFKKSELLDKETFGYLFSISGNESTEPRTGTIVFTGDGGDPISNVEINQPGMVTPVITITSDDLIADGDNYKIDLSYSGGTIIFDVDLTYNNIEISKDNWIQLTENSKDNHYEYLVSEYSLSRKGSIVITSSNINGGTTLSDTVTIFVNQTSEPVTLSVSPEEAEEPLDAYISDNNISTEFTITCNYDDFSVLSPDWIKCEKLSNEGNNYQYRATIIKDNPDIMARTGIINIVRTPNQATFKLTQKGKEQLPSFSLSESNFDVGYEENEISVNILELSENAEIKAKIPEEIDWISEKSNESNTIIFTILKNESSDPREGTIEIIATNKEGSTSKEITVNQKGKPEIELIGSKFIDIPAIPEDNAIQFKIICKNIDSYDIKITEEAIDKPIDWITYDEEDSTLENLVFNATKNLTSSKRVGYITLINGEAVNGVVVEQTWITPTITTEPDSSAGFNVSSEGEKLSFTASTNITGDIITSSIEETYNWIVKNEDESNQNTFVFDISSNPNSDERIGYITLSTDNATLKISITQSGTAIES